MHFWGKSKKKKVGDSRDMRSTFDRDKVFLQPSASDLSLQVVLKSPNRNEVMWSSTRMATRFIWRVQLRIGKVACGLKRAENVNVHDQELQQRMEVISE